MDHLHHRVPLVRLLQQPILFLDHGRSHLLTQLDLAQVVSLSSQQRALREEVNG